MTSRGPFRPKTFYDSMILSFLCFFFLVDSSKKDSEPTRDLGKREAIPNLELGSRSLKSQPKA